MAFTPTSFMCIDKNNQNFIETWDKISLRQEFKILEQPFASLLFLFFSPFPLTTFQLTESSTTCWILRFRISAWKVQRNARVMHRINLFCAEFDAFAMFSCVETRSSLSKVVLFWMFQEYKYLNNFFFILFFLLTF